MNELVAKEKPPHPIVMFKRDMEAMTQELTMLDDKAKARMKSAAIVAVTKDHTLLSADRASFMMAIRMCASHGVIPDGNEATLQTYSTKVKGADGKEDWIQKVTYLPMVRGIINRVQRSGKVKLFYAETVCDGEDFRLDLSHGDRRPVHDFNPMNRSGEIIGAYSVVTYEDGTIDTEPMPRAEIDKVRAVAKTQKVWDGWFAEKAKVAVMKRHSKRLPLSAEDMDFILNRDETDFDQAPRDVTPKEPGGFAKLAQSARAPRQIASEPADVSEPPPEPEALQPASDEAPHWTLAIDIDTAFPGSPEWMAGIAACKAGAQRETCPHEGVAQKAADWLGGYEGQLRATE